MTKTELQAVLGYVNVGLAVAHNMGVSVGHFGETDFLTLAQAVNAMLLGAIAPPTAVPAVVTPVAAAAPTAAAA